MSQSSVQKGEWGAALRTVLEAATDAIAVHRDGKIVYANAAGLKLLGYTALADVVGKPVLDFVAPHNREVVAKRVFKTYAGGGNLPELEERFLDIGGHEVPVEVLAIPLIFEGQPSTLVHIRDIRVRKELENKLHAADRLAHVGFVAAAVMHEIRGPLGYALTSVELLKSRIGETAPSSREELGQLCDHVREGLDRLRDVVRDLGVFSGTLKDSATDVDLHAVLDSIANLIGFELHGRARLVKSYGHIAHVRGTQAKLGHVFANLMVNAAQAIPPGAEDDNEITVRTYAEPGKVLVDISDTGEGIPSERLRDVFEPFVTTRENGTGLGLAIARSILEQSGGHLRVESKLGRGTTFTVELPAAT